MDLQLENKSVFISGSTAGIGFETARQFLQEGANVIINGRSGKGTEAALKRLKSEFPNAKVSGIDADLGDPGGCREALSRLGSVDILINNLGIYTSQSFEMTSDEDWQRLFEVNVMTAVRLSRHLLTSMKTQGFGRIIFVSSECAELVPADLIAYSTTKAALHALSKGLAQSCRGENVTVNTVLPGSTMTEGAKDFIQNLADQEGKTFNEAERSFIESNRRNSTLQRFLSPSEIAHGILYLSSPLSSATNGAVLKLDGGSTGGF